MLPRVHYHHYSKKVHFFKKKCAFSPLVEKPDMARPCAIYHMVCNNVCHDMKVRLASSNACGRCGMRLCVIEASSWDACMVSITPSCMPFLGLKQCAHMWCMLLQLFFRDSISWYRGQFDRDMQNLQNSSFTTILPHLADVGGRYSMHQTSSLTIIYNISVSYNPSLTFPRGGPSIKTGSITITTRYTMSPLKNGRKSLKKVFPSTAQIH